MEDNLPLLVGNLDTHNYLWAVSCHMGFHRPHTPCLLGTPNHRHTQESQSLALRRPFPRKKTRMEDIPHPQDMEGMLPQHRSHSHRNPHLFHRVLPKRSRAPSKEPNLTSNLSYSLPLSSDPHSRFVPIQHVVYASFLPTRENNCFPDLHGSITSSTDLSRSIEYANTK